MRIKFFAWEERHRQHPGRDAKDIAYLFKHIESLYPPDKLFGDHPRAVEVADYKIQNAGYYQLGFDVAELIAEEDQTFLNELLAIELKDNEDSVLCRELHKYTDMQTLEETRNALHYFYKGLEHA
jgi:predicted nucleotidyltransferase